MADIVKEAATVAITAAMAAIKKNEVENVHKAAAWRGILAELITQHTPACPSKGAIGVNYVCAELDCWRCEAVRASQLQILGIM
jgi:PP-loop superfamily ATP-utilizing enzyme